MYQRVKAYIEKYHMLQNGDKVIVGISGGADSVCLLFMLLELKKEMDISIVAVHVHHGLREGSADADEAYVRELCERQQIRLIVCHEDVKAYAQQQKLTVEEAGRNIRSFGRVAAIKLRWRTIRMIMRRPFCGTCAGDAAFGAQGELRRRREIISVRFCVWNEERLRSILQTGEYLIV